MPQPTTNVLIALKNMLVWNNRSMPVVVDYTSNNRINSTGDLLEYYIKDAFCGESAELEVTADKLCKYQQHFSYLGNSNNPPDFIIQKGPAVEVKKVEGNGVGDLALNSSFPKNYLHNDDVRISRNCRGCEDAIGGWSRKDMIYAVGNVEEKQLKKLWLVYGDCYAADKDTYEKIARTIKDGVSAIPGVEFGETKELGRVNRVDPLGITHLRVRGMWTIQHPSAVFRTITNPDPVHTHIYVLMRKDTHEQITSKPDFTEFISKEVLTIRDVSIPNPDNPAQTMEAILYTALI